MRAPWRGRICGRWVAVFHARRSQAWGVALTVNRGSPRSVDVMFGPFSFWVVF